MAKCAARRALSASVRNLPKQAGVARASTGHHVLGFRAITRKNGHTGSIIARNPLTAAARLYALAIDDFMTENLSSSSGATIPGSTLGSSDVFDVSSLRRPRRLSSVQYSYDRPFLQCTNRGCHARGIHPTPQTDT